MGGGELSVARLEAQAAKRAERLQRARRKLDKEWMRHEVAIAKTEAAEAAGSTGAASGSRSASASTSTSAAQPSLTSRNDGETAASLNQQADLPSTSRHHVSIDIVDALPPYATPPPPKKSKLAAQLSAQQWLSREMEAPPSSSRKGRLGGNPSRRRAAIGIATEQDSTRSSNLSSTRSRDNEEVDNEPGGLLAPQSPDRGSSSATAQDGVAVPRAAWKITRFARFVARI